MLTLVRMLQTQRALFNMPRGMARFKEYLRIMIGGSNDFILPLQAMNPMGKAHVAQTLDDLLRMDAEAIVAQALTEGERRLGCEEVTLRVGLVVADDVAGSWTCRELIEANVLRRVPTPMINRGWLAITYWAGEPVTEQKVREEALAGLYRFLFLMTHGAPDTLHDMMFLGGNALAFAGVSMLAMSESDLAKIDGIIKPHRNCDAFCDFPTVFTCLFGDAAARHVGYDAMGLPPRAGCALSLAEIESTNLAPERALSHGWPRQLLRG
jgi:hypothetical protein